MTTSLRTPRRTATTALLTAALLGAGGTAAATASVPADPTCAEVLARASTWPGTVSVDGQIYRLYSDAYGSHLTRQPPCAEPGA